MPSIDERIVEMKFKRDDFIRGTEETLGALERIEKALGGTGAISSGIGDFAGKFSILGTVATGALFKVGQMATKAGSDIASFVMEPLFGGGKRRAQNLEQAAFQLNGILKNGDAVKAVMDDVAYGVNDTAYGLDAAAIAASQFAASGIKAGDDMKAALRGISGVAAMSNSSYEDISSVFTKVAGQGRMMGDDLNRLAARGINAASTIAEYFNATGEGAKKTEADVREMVSKGKIDFATFAKAMDGAFGPHAKKANELYSGSLMNLRAALARISAPIYTMQHEALRRVFNAVRPVVNNFQKALQDLYPVIDELIMQPFARTVERWAKSMEGFDFTKIVSGVGKFMRLFATGREVISSWLKPIGGLAKALLGLFAGSDGSDKMGSGLDRITESLKKLTLSDASSEKIVKFFERCVEAIKNFGGWLKKAGAFISPGVEAIVKGFRWGMDRIVEGFNFVKPYVTDFFDFLFGHEGKVTTFFKSIGDDIQEAGGVFEYLGEAWEQVQSKYIEPIFTMFKDLGKVIEDFRKGTIENLGDALENAFSPMKGVRKWITDAKDAFVEFAKSLPNPLEWLKSQLPAIGESLREFFTGVKEVFTPMGAELGGGVGDIISAIADVIKFLVESIAGVNPQDLEKFIKGLVGIALALRTYQTIGALKGVFDSVTGFVNELTGSITAFNERANKSAKADNFLKISIGIGILAAALWLLSGVDKGQLFISIAAIALMGAAIVGLMYAMSKIDNEGIMKTSGGMILLAIALGLMTSVLLTLGLIPFPTLQQGMISLGILLGMLVITGAILGPLTPNFHLTGVGLMALAVALSLLLIPILVLGNMELEALGQGLFGVALALTLLTFSVAILGPMGPQIAVTAAAMIGFAFAMIILAQAISTMSSMNPAEMGQGLAGIAIGLLLVSSAAFALNTLGAGVAGVLALSIAMIAVAFALNMLASVPMGAAAGGLVLMAIALGILVGASYLAMGALPGVLGLSALMLAFSVACLVIAAATVIFALGIGILAAVLPTLLPPLAGLVAMGPGMLVAAPGLTAFAVALGIFGVAALIAGPGAIALGAGFLLMAIGLAALAAMGDAAPQVLTKFVEGIKGLIWDVPAILGISAGILALGAALVVLGAGLIVAGVGGVLFGLGAMIASVGILLLGLTAEGARESIFNLVPALEQLAGTAGGITYLSMYIENCAKTVNEFTIALDDMSSSIERMTSTAWTVTGAFMYVGDAVTTMSFVVQAGLEKVSTSMTASNQVIESLSGVMESRFTALKDRIVASTRPIESSISNMSSQISSHMQRARNVTEYESGVIIASFQRMIDKANEMERSTSGAARTMAQVLAEQLNKAKTDTNKSITNIDKEFQRLSKTISQNGSAASDAVKTLSSKINTALDTVASSAYTKAKGIGANIVRGVAAGMSENMGTVRAKAQNVAQSAIDAANEKLGIRSPSRVFYQMAVYTVAGFVNGMGDSMSKVENKSSEMSSAIMDGVNKTISEMEGQFNDMDGLGFSPTITPILDLSEMNRQAVGLSSVIGSVSLSRSQAESLASMDDALSGRVPETAAVGGNTYQFVQNNNSPKALSESEIYRNTKNLFASYARKDTVDAYSGTNEESGSV